MHEPDDEDYLARPAAIRMERAVKRFDLTDRRPNFGGNHSLGDSSEVREGLLAGGTTGSLAGMTMVMGTVKLKIEADDDAVSLVELPMRPNLVADGMPLRSCSKLFARVQHDACSLPVEIRASKPASNLREFAEQGGTDRWPQAGSIWGVPIGPVAVPNSAWCGLSSFRSPRHRLRDD
jgi:hypothetical protein